MAKKARSFLHLILFMLKKGISKAKLLTDLTTMIKRSKIAGKSLHHLLHHHHHHHPPSGDYEFTCNNTPPYPLSLFSTHNHHHRRRDSHLRQPDVDDSNHDDMVVIDAAVMKEMEEMMTRADASPEVIERLRITGSPFPVSDGDGDGGEVDEAADKFIMRFYSGLRREN